jgi:alkylation response protein AidB-like acyl-CoA dehydrogenase
MAAPPQLGVVAARGGSFLLEDRRTDEVFAPEDFTEEQRMIARAAEDFMETEMVPRLPEILALRYDATRELLRKAGEVGLLGVEIPAEYGGLGLDKVSGCLIAEKAARDGSFAVSFTGHVGHRLAAHRLLRDGGAEAESTCPAGQRGVDQAPTRSPRPRPPPTP